MTELDQAVEMCRNEVVPDPWADAARAELSRLREQVAAGERLAEEERQRLKLEPWMKPSAALAAWDAAKEKA